MGITPLMFTGVSKYSSDLQSILNRSVQIAELPLQALQQSQLKETDRKTALGSLQALAAQFSSTLQSLSSLTGSNGLMATSDTTSVVTATNTGSAQLGSHVITDVTQLATATSTTSTGTYATADTTPVAGAGNYLELWVGNNRTTWTLPSGSDNLNAVANWINTTNQGVTASVIKSDAGYSLSVTANQSGAQTIELYNVADKGGPNLLKNVTTGRPLIFTIDGQQVTRSSDVVTDVVPGVALTFTGTTSAPTQKVNISTTRSAGSVENILQTLAAQYNALQTELAKHTGSAGGALTGDIVLSEVRGALAPLASITPLMNAGITFTGTDGVMSFDPTTINSLDSNGLQNLITQLADTTTGVGPLATQWQGLTDPVTGVIPTEEAQIDTTNLRLTQQITDMSTNINKMQQDLLSRLQAADALLSQLESQQGMLTASINSLNYVAYGYQQNQSSGG